MSILSSGKFASPWNSRFRLIFNDLLHVPTITKNLSVCQCAKDNHVYFEFHPNLWFVKRQASNDILLKGWLDKDGLYKFPSLLNHSRSAATPSHSVSYISSSTYSVVNTPTANGISFLTWHSRFGHPSGDVQHFVLKFCYILFLLIIRVQMSLALLVV